MTLNYPTVYDKKLGNIYITCHALERFSERLWRAGFKMPDKLLDSFCEEWKNSARVKENSYNLCLKNRAKDKTIFFENGVWRFVIKSGFLVTAELSGEFRKFNK